MFLPDPLSLIYRSAVGFRNFLYDRGFLKTLSVEVPVISVGNLSVGGSGKTSLVRFLAQKLGRKNSVGIVLRGYRRKTKGTLAVSDGLSLLMGVEEAGDEAWMLAKFLKGVVVVVSEDKLKGCYEAVKKGAGMIIIDDGFQHRRLKRDIDIVCLSKKDLRSRLLPFGRLREPFSSLRRADAIVLSYQETEPFDFEWGDKPVFRMYRRFKGLLRSDFSSASIEEIRDRDIVAFAGLGNNEQFFKAVENLGLKIVKKICFRDHYSYRGFSLERNITYLTTPKDLVKLHPAENLYALDFDLEVPGLLEFITCRISC